jgi:hypothetical protein
MLRQSQIHPRRKNAVWDFLRANDTRFQSIAYPPDHVEPRSLYESFARVIKGAGDSPTFDNVAAGGYVHATAEQMRMMSNALTQWGVGALLQKDDLKPGRWLPYDDAMRALDRADRDRDCGADHE